jgi:hypothetical protein
MRAFKPKDVNLFLLELFAAEIFVALFALEEEVYSNALIDACYPHLGRNNYEIKIVCGEKFS